MKDIHEVLRRKQAKYAQLAKQIEALQQPLDELGWEAPLGEQAGALIDRIRRLDTGSPALEALLKQYAGTQRKYGISTTA